MKQNPIHTLNANIEQLLQQDEKPLTFKEAADYLGVSKSYLYKISSTKKIPFYKPAGKMIYFLKSDLNKYIFRNRKASDSELEQIAVDKVYQSA